MDRKGERLGPGWATDIVKYAHKFDFDNISLYSTTETPHLGRIFHRTLSLLPSHHPAHSWHHIAGRHGGHQVLHHTESLQTEGIRGVDRCRYANLLLIWIGLGHISRTRQLQQIHK